MTSWTPPVTTWAPTDGIANTDLNRIEENTEYLYDRDDEYAQRVQLCGTLATDSGVTIGPGDVNTVFRTSVQVPDGYELRITRINWWTSGALTRAYVEVSVPSGGTPYTSGAATGDESPNFLLYSNSSGSSVLCRLVGGIYNGDTGGSFSITRSSEASSVMAYFTVLPI